jgi:hypothetical protein
MIHGGTLVDVVSLDTGIVLGCYCSLELVRTSAEPWYRAPALVGFLIYGFLVGVDLYYTAPYVPQLFGI